MLDLPLLKKKKKKTGFNLDAALELTSSPSEEQRPGNEEATAGTDEAGADEGTANAGDDFDLDMDFSKIKKKKKKTKKGIDDLLPEKGDDDNQDDRENGRSNGFLYDFPQLFEQFRFALHALTIPRDSSRIMVNHCYSRECQ